MNPYLRLDDSMLLLLVEWMLRNRDPTNMNVHTNLCAAVPMYGTTENSLLSGAVEDDGRNATKQ